MRIRYEYHAVSQLEQIHGWLTEQADSDTAARIIGDLLAHCSALADFPHRGSPRDDIRPGLRTLPHKRGRFTIGYRVVGEDVIILGVIGRGRQLEALVEH